MVSNEDKLQLMLLSKLYAFLCNEFIGNEGDDDMLKVIGIACQSPICGQPPSRHDLERLRMIILSTLRERKASIYCVYHVMEKLKFLLNEKHALVNEHSEVMPYVIDGLNEYLLFPLDDED